MIESEVESFLRVKTDGHVQHDNGNMRIERIKAWSGCEGIHENEGRIHATNAFAFIGVRLDRGNSFTLHEVVVIGPRVR